jgi:hypothetical protein
MNPPLRDRNPGYARRAGVVLFLVGWINFAWFVAGIFALGGEAWHGSVKNGKYFLDYNGTPTQTSRFVWNYSYYHALSVCVTHPLGLFGIAGLMVFANWWEKKYARTPEGSDVSFPPPTGQPA